MKVRTLLLATAMAAASAAEAQPVKTGVDPSALGGGYDFRGAISGKLSLSQPTS